MGASLDYDGGLSCSLGVRDLESSINWYTDRLGFSFMYKVDEMGWCEMMTHIDGVRVGLSQVESPEVKGGATLTLGVNNIDQARSALEAKDVRFDGETLQFPGMVSLATFFDPDGNKFMLYQDLSEH